MSNTEKEIKRPLDAEELTETQIEGVSGGKTDSDSGNKPDQRKFRFNSSYINVSDRD